MTNEDERKVDVPEVKRHGTEMIQNDDKTGSLVCGHCEPTVEDKVEILQSEEKPRVSKRVDFRITNYKSVIETSLVDASTVNLNESFATRSQIIVRNVYQKRAVTLMKQHEKNGNIHNKKVRNDYRKLATGDKSIYEEFHDGK